MLRLITRPARGRRTVTPDPELKRMLDEMRRRLSLSRVHGENDAEGRTPPSGVGHWASAQTWNYHP